jgi:cytochrome d ubiquinol oxidase subunit II
VATVLAVVFLLWTQLAYSDKAWTWALVVVAAVALLAGLAMNPRGREGWAFIFSAITLAGAVASCSACCTRT